MNVFSCIHSKPINIRWVRTGSHPYEKLMSSIVLYPVLYEYKNVQFIHYTMREITNINLFLDPRKLAVTSPVLCIFAPATEQNNIPPCQQLPPTPTCPPPPATSTCPTASCCSSTSRSKRLQPTTGSTDLSRL